MEIDITDKNIRTELAKLLSLISEDETIQQFKQLEKKISSNKKLTKLEEAIKKAQKEAVQFRHYEKPEAEKETNGQVDQLIEEFNEHPLVVTYRDRLIEANDLLQYVTNQIQYRVNEELEKEG